ncbi:MAG: PQQ-binding-like beta-propeller repeat protein [Anaerolineae bacterium]|nr:PQQ-binding-like beta-propeller repeat protein [Anaerolineae bacterium]
MKLFVLKQPVSSHKGWTLGGLMLVFALLSGCESATPESFPRPLLVTMPAMAVPLPTVTPVPEMPVTEDPLVVETPSPTPDLPAQGLETTHLLWEWGENSRPSGLAATPNRLAVIASDGRFVWMTADTGKLEGGAYLWSGILQGDTWGEVYTDGIVAMVAAIREVGIDAETGLAESRARLVVFDTQANELWSLPQLDSRHYYSATIAPGPGLVVIGRWPQGFKDNEMAAYEMFTGQRLWRVKSGETGYRQLTHDGTRMYVLLTDPKGIDTVGCYDLRTGDQLWQWAHPELAQLDQITVGPEGVYVMAGSQILGLDTTEGTVKWTIGFSASSEAGISTRGNLLYAAPAPSAQTGFRPGVVSLDGLSGQLVWNALGGLLADPLIVGNEALWTIVKNFDSGEVFLSGLEPDTGLERTRLLVGMDPKVIYRLVSLDRRVYVLGDTLQSYGY